MAEFVYECWSEDGQHKMFFISQETETPGVLYSDIGGDKLTGYPCFISLDCLVEQIETAKMLDADFPDIPRLMRIQRGIKDDAFLPIVVLDPPTMDAYPSRINEGRHRVLVALELGLSKIPVLISNTVDAQLVEQFFSQATVAPPSSIRINRR